MNEPALFTVGPDDDGLRIDVFLAGMFPDVSRTFLQKVIRDGGVLCEQHSVRPGYRLQTDEIVSVSLPELREPEILPEDIPLEIVYEDDDVLVVNKPQGMVVHPSAGHLQGTLVNALLYHCRGSLSGINGVLRPGIVHRIDKDTSGLLVVCKNDQAHRSLAEQFAAHQCTREYRALVHGRISEEESSIEGNIGRDPRDRKKMAVVPEDKGKTAITHVRVLECFADMTYVACVLETGRTHQIRVHLAHTGHPVVGDPLYGPRKCPYPELNGQLLHAMTLGFTHPLTGEAMHFSAPLPDYFQKSLQKNGSHVIIENN